MTLVSASLSAMSIILFIRGEGARGVCLFKPTRFPIPWGMSKQLLERPGLSYLGKRPFRVQLQLPNQPQKLCIFRGELPLKICTFGRLPTPSIGKFANGATGCPEMSNNRRLLGSVPIDDPKASQDSGRLSPSNGASKRVPKKATLPSSRGYCVECQNSFFRRLGCPITSKSKAGGNPASLGAHIVGWVVCV